MLRLLLLLFLPVSCPTTPLFVWAPELRYEVHVEPSQNKLEITGSLDAIRPGTYFFILPRTQGAPLQHFIRHIEFSDASGPLEYTLTDEREWRVKTKEESISFTYTINLRQSDLYEKEAWGGSTNMLDDRMAFLSGGFSFIIPLVKGLDSAIEVSWKVPPAWKVVTPWSNGALYTRIPSQYALVRNYYTVYKDGSSYSRRIRTMDLTTIWLGKDNINNFPQAQRAITKVVEAALMIFGEEASREGVTLILRDSNSFNQFRASTESNSIEFNFKKGITFDQLWNTYREGFLRLLAHEIMHTWDRRKIDQASSYLHVPEWGPNTCWLREGFTEYFAMLNLYNADIYDRDQFLSAMHSLKMTANKLNLNQSLDLSSSCIDFFRRDFALQYVYTEGAVLAFMLDLSLREATNGVKSLPLFMRAFMTQYRYEEKTVEAFMREWKAYAPRSLHDIDSLVKKKSPTDLREPLAKMGISLAGNSSPHYPQWDVSSNAPFKWYFD